MPACFGCARGRLRREAHDDLFKWLIRDDVPCGGEGALKLNLLWPSERCCGHAGATDAIHPEGAHGAARLVKSNQIRCERCGGRFNQVRMHACGSRRAGAAPCGRVLKFKDAPVHPCICKDSKARLRLRLIAQLADLRDGALNGRPQRFVQHSAELHQRGTKFRVVSGGELRQEARRQDDRNRLIATESKGGEKPTLQDAPASVFIPDRDIDFALKRLQVAVGGAAADAELLREVVRSDPRFANRLHVFERAEESGGAVALGEVFAIGVGLSLGHVPDCATPPPAAPGVRAAACTKAAQTRSRSAGELSVRSG